MIATFVIALKHLQIAANLGRGDKLDDCTYISNDASILESLLPNNAKQLIGVLEYDYLLNSKAYIYSKEDIKADSSVEDYLATKLYQVQAFLTMSWIYCDNSIDFEAGFLFFRDDISSQEGASSNTLGGPVTTAQGDEVETIFNREKLRAIRKIYREEVSKYTYCSDSKNVTLLHKGRSRQEVAYYHIMAARLTEDVGLKISNYCTALEALFSTSQSELSHQLSERVAFFISESNEERLSIYRTLKKLYNTRSKIVHGSLIREKDFDAIIKQSEFCDESLRKCLLKMYNNKGISRYFEGKSENLDEYMLRLIFGADNSP